MHLLPSKATAVFYVQKPYIPAACICGSVLGDSHFVKVVLSFCAASTGLHCRADHIQSFNPLEQKKQAALKSKQVFLYVTNSKARFS